MLFVWSVTESAATKQDFIKILICAIAVSKIKVEQYAGGSLLLNNKGNDSSYSDNGMEVSGNMGKGKGRAFFEIDEGNKASKPGSSVRKAKTYSPASDLLYRRAMSSQPDGEKPGEKRPASAPYDKKTAMFWMFACAVVGIGAYMLIVASVTGKDNVAKAKDDSLDKGSDPSKTVVHHFAAEKKRDQPGRKESKPRELTMKREIRAEKAANMNWTVRIIQLSAAKRDILSKLLKTKEVRSLVGNHECFMVDVRRGQIVGCVGRFESSNAAQAIELARALDGFRHGKQKPFKGAMPWKYK